MHAVRRAACFFLIDQQLLLYIVDELLSEKVSGLYLYCIHDNE